MKPLYLLFFLVSQMVSSQTDSSLYGIIENISAQRIESDVRTLANFETRNTFSDTVSNKRGIGAARRWIKSEFDLISKECNNCLNVFYQKDFVTKKDGDRIPKDAWIVNVKTGIIRELKEQKVKENKKQKGIRKIN